MVPKTSNNTLNRYKRLVAQLEKALVRQNRKLLKVPARFGFTSVSAFIAALKAAEKQTPAATVAPRKQTAKKAGRRRRAKITPETKSLVQSLVKAGKTGTAIAKQAGISVPSVAKIKRELGLTRTKA